MAEPSSFKAVMPLEILGTAATGLGAGLALIVAIGAQNAFVLRQGIRGEHVGLVVLVCMLSDIVLIGAGILGIGAVITAVPAVVVVIRLAGAAFLLGYAALAAKRAVRPGVLTAGGQQGSLTRKAVLATALTLTWLNPHVYLDTVVMLGTLATQHGADRWVFAAGAGTGSIVWFTALGFGATALSRPLGRPSTWRVVDILVGLTMLAVAVRLATEAF